MFQSESESEDDLQHLPSDSGGSDGGLDQDYRDSLSPRTRSRRTDDDDFTEEESSDEEWNDSPVKERPPRRQCRSLYASLVSSPLKSASKKVKVKLHSAFTPNDDDAPPHKGRTLHPSCRKTLHSRRQAKGQKLNADDGEDEDRWRDVDEDDDEPPQPRFKPDRDVGPQLNRTANYTPLELFQLFFSSTVIDTLVMNTNAYGERKHKGQKESWVPVTVPDMHSFICLVLYMGMVPLKTLKEFWRGSKLFSLPFPASVMPCRRFLAISRSLHMNDPKKEAANDQKKGTPEYDKLSKIKPLYEQIIQACHTFFHPHQHVSIDERIVASKARFGFKQYIKNKPTKWGFKLFVLADSTCGYTLNFFVYVGKENAQTGKGQSYDAVMRLLNVPFLGKGYKLYVDNFYTSPTLFLDLLQKKIWACGTVRANVIGYPKTKKTTALEKTTRGTIRWIRKGQLLFVKWFDRREVTMCTTIHKVYGNDTATRKVKATDGQWSIKQVPIPSCIKDYNKYMGGVDLSDALIGYYNVLHKTRRWYKTLFYHFVDIATVNAFILHKDMCKLQNRVVLTQKAFREQLILSLAEIGSSPSRSAPQNFMLPASPIKATFAPSPVKVNMSSQIKGLITSHPPQPGATPGSTTSVSLRHLTDAPPGSASSSPGLGHLPSYFVENMSNIASRNRATAGRRACVVCKRKSPVYCSTCQKTLCFTSLRNCYSEWHRKNNICV
ncbi:piggyBac transposable element-derived protein 4-like [Gouania willdenowi]|uniref:PiggyBac transposable element-derived protein 4-like n=1 Tax=Gouania willdenowi TaxID=441366 RepID=A0A8C5EPA5_GOUWI|nr:piggyBac transposable element-derived protein 4-like [Gouania willdenowi]